MSPDASTAAIYPFLRPGEVLVMDGNFSTPDHRWAGRLFVGRHHLYLWAVGQAEPIYMSRPQVRSVSVQPLTEWVPGFVHARIEVAADNGEPYVFAFPLSHLVADQLRRYWS
jgi:hypothetical protein